MYTIEEGDLDNNNFIKLAIVTIIICLLAHDQLNSYIFMIVGGAIGYIVSESALIEIS